MDNAKVIHLGCGVHRLPGWENHDSDVDITRRLPWQDSTVDFIHIEHCLEHVNCSQGFKFMLEALRILKPGAVIRICVPDTTRSMPPSKRADLYTNHGHQMAYSTTMLRLMLETAGFREVRVAEFNEKTDSHWKTIGREADEMETLRVEAVK